MSERSFSDIMNAKIDHVKQFPTLPIEGDLEVRDEGSIILFTPRTDAGKKFIRENLPDHGPDGPLFFGKALVIEHSYADIWIDSAIEEGLKVIPV